MNWHDVSAIAGSAAPVIAIAWGWVNRTWLSHMFVSKIALASTVYHQQKRIEDLTDTVSGLRDQASSWRGAAEAGAFTRSEAELLMVRVSKLEEFVPKFKSAIFHIQNLNRVIVALLSKLKEHNIAPECDIPTIPDLILEDVNHEVEKSK